MDKQIAKIAKNESAFVELLNQETKELKEHLDYIDGYKQGFKDGVIAFRTQFEEKALPWSIRPDGTVRSYLIYTNKLDEIVKELVDEDAKESE